MIETESARSWRAQDPLSEKATKERRYLIALSFAAIIVRKAGLFPTKISAFGIDFSPADRKTFIVALAAAVAYFLLAFIVYAARDALAYVIEVLETVRNETRERARKEAISSPLAKDPRDVQAYLDRIDRRFLRVCRITWCEP